MPSTQIAESIAHFYPRPPRGGRPMTTAYRRAPRIFLSTPSARRATHGLAAISKAVEISIHALREEGDAFTVRPLLSVFYFYPRPPRGGRPSRIRAGSRQGRISIHALREEGDTTICRFRGGKAYFYPRPPRGGRLLQLLLSALPFLISIHALREEGDPRRDV